MGALRGHMRSHVTWHKDPLFKALLTLEELQALCPTATFIEPDAMVEPFLGRGGETCLGRLAAGKQRILVVSHREGIKDLVLNKCSKTITKARYCAIAKFGYEDATQNWEYFGLAYDGS